MSGACPLDWTAQTTDLWRLMKVDGQRWKIATDDAEGWAPMPRCLYHSQLHRQMSTVAKMAQRNIAQGALDAYRRGETPPCYRYTPSGVLELCRGAA